jgi:hypothetical protein
VGVVGNDGALGAKEKQEYKEFRESEAILVYRNCRT